jgi:hypothetical protein
MYAEWQGRTFSATDTVRPPRSVILWTEDPASTAAGFTEATPGRFRRVVPESELTALFELKTRCRWKGEPCRVIRRNENGSLQLEWERTDEELAKQLGFSSWERGIYVTAVPPSEVTDLRQERSEIPLA